MTPTDTLREAVIDAIIWSQWDEEGEVFDAAWLIEFKTFYPDHHDQAKADADAALSAIEAAGWRIVPANMFDRISNDVAEMPNSADEVTPVTFRTAFEIERDRLGSKAAAPRLDATVRGEEG